MDFLYCYHMVLLLVASLAFVLLAIGYATPGWLLVTFDETFTAQHFTVSSLNRSLWYDIHCPWELDDCTTCAYTDSEKCVTDMAFPDYESHYYWVEALSSRNDKDKWLLWRILQTIVMATAIAGYVIVISIVCCLLHPSNYRLLCTVGLLLWAVAAILVWPVVGMVADLHNDIRDDINNSVLHDATLDIPYSLVLSAVGGLFALVTAIMLIWLTGVCGRREEDTGSELVSEQQSKELRMSRPITQRSYYGPYPYYLPERQTEYYQAPADQTYRQYEYSRDQSGTPRSEDNAYIVESPYYTMPQYYNHYYDADFYDNGTPEKSRRVYKSSRRRESDDDR